MVIVELIFSSGGRKGNFSHNLAEGRLGIGVKRWCKLGLKSDYVIACWLNLARRDERSFRRLRR